MLAALICLSPLRRLRVGLAFLRNNRGEKTGLDYQMANIFCAMMQNFLRGDLSMYFPLPTDTPMSLLRARQLRKIKTFCNPR